MLGHSGYREAVKRGVSDENSLRCSPVALRLLQVLYSVQPGLQNSVQARINSCSPVHSAPVRSVPLVSFYACFPRVRGISAQDLLVFRSGCAIAAPPIRAAPASFALTSLSSARRPLRSPDHGRYGTPLFLTLRYLPERRGVFGLGRFAFLVAGFYRCRLHGRLARPISLPGEFFKFARG